MALKLKNLHDVEKIQNVKEERFSPRRNLGQAKTLDFLGSKLDFFIYYHDQFIDSTIQFQ